MRPWLPIQTLNDDSDDFLNVAWKSSKGAHMIGILERLGVPRSLMLGFLAVAIFMTGDGFELTFLSKFMVDQGFASSQASLLVTIYGLFAALGGWSAGVLAEMFGARRVMLFGACWWIGIHLLFLGVAIPSHVYLLILGLYALRGIGYPLFIYSFVVLMAQYISPARLASATGFFWTCFSLGIGVFGAYLPSFIMPVFGEYKTFWFALPFSVAGTVMCFFFVPKNKIVKGEGLSRKEQLKELTEGATILVTNRKILICAIIRIINNLLLYGFPVIMPLYLCTAHNGGINIFKTEEWMRIWGFVFVVTLIFNTFWGWFMDRFGWVWPMRWFGCAVLAVGSVAFYYIPQWFGANALMMIVAGDHRRYRYLRLLVASDHHDVVCRRRQAGRGSFRIQSCRRPHHIRRPRHCDDIVADHRLRRCVLDLCRALRAGIRADAVYPPEAARLRRPRASHQAYGSAKGPRGRDRESRAGRRLIRRSGGVAANLVDEGLHETQCRTDFVLVVQAQTLT